MKTTTPITKVIYNAQIITLDDQRPRAEAMALTGDKIHALGSNDEMLTLASNQTETIDLQGKIVIPGFNDSHMHLLNWGQGMEALSLTNTSSLQELINKGIAYAQQNPAKKWIIGRGWNDEDFKEKRLPTAADLDLISTSVPVVLTRACGHICAVNSVALKLAGINKDTIDPAGGSIDRSPDREPTGILRENAIARVKDLIPTPTVAELKEFLRTAARSAAALGLTTVQSNDLQGTATLANRLKAYQELVEEDQLPVRVNLQATMATKEELSAYLEMKESWVDLNKRVSLGPLKLYADGSLGGRTAALTFAYADAPETSGMTLYSQAELDELVILAAQANLPVAIHAIGDLAIDLVLNSYERAKREVPSWNKRPRIIHCQISRLDQLQRMKKLQVVADIQPIFVPTDRHFVEQRIGKENIRYSYAWKTMQELGIPTAGGSDCPVESCNPFWGLHAAITREGWQQQECLTPVDALKLFTLGSAYATEAEGEKGSLTPGKLADFIVLPKDPTNIPAAELLNLEVSATYLGGIQVFSRN